MSAENTSLGPDAKIEVNGVAFAVTEGQYRLVGDAPPDNDTETPGFHKFKEDGMLVLEVELTAHKQTDVAPHVAPLAIIPTQFIELEIWPTGAGNGSYYSATFIVKDFTGNFRVANSEPQTIRLSGSSSGEIQLPND